MVHRSLGKIPIYVGGNTTYCNNGGLQDKTIRFIGLVMLAPEKDRPAYSDPAYCRNIQFGGTHWRW